MTSITTESHHFTEKFPFALLGYPIYMKNIQPLCTIRARLTFPEDAVSRTGSTFGVVTP